MHKIIVEDFSLSPFNSLNEWFSQVQHLSGASLLHSGDSEHPNAQFHFAALQPLISLEIHETGGIDLNFPYLNDFVTEDNNETIKQQVRELVAKKPTVAETNTLLEQIQNILFGEADSERIDFPFQVGCMGYAGYDFGRFLEVLPEHTRNSYKTPVFTAHFYSWSLVENIADKKVCLSYHNRFTRPKFTFDQDPRSLSPFMLTSDWQSNMTRQDYVRKLNRIHEYLLSGDCYQVNLAQRFSAQYEGSEWHAWQTLCAHNQAPFSAFLRLPESCIISCSPERFLSVTNGTIETKPIKGTRPRFANTEQDELSKQELLASEKDRAENLMIVDLLRNDISKNAEAFSVEVNDLFAIESFSAVHHLVSTVRAKMAKLSTPLTVFRDAFPGGSITGAPKIRAMEIIDELEPQRRNIYCGSIFYLSSRGQFDSNITIRTLLLENNHIYCWAGGGIVADSDPELEYQETFHKVEKILPVLAKTKSG